MATAVSTMTVDEYADRIAASWKPLTNSQRILIASAFAAQPEDD